MLEYRKAAGAFESRLFGSGLCVTRINGAAGEWGNLGGPPFFIYYYYRVGGTTSNDGYGNAWEACLSAETGRTQCADQSNPACFLSNGNTCGIAITQVGTTTGSTVSFSLSDPATVVATQSITGYLVNAGNRVSGATLQLSGDTSATVTTDSLGRYVLTVPKGGSYVVTPTKPHLTFVPSSKVFTTATIAGSAPGGTVTFSAAGIALCTAVAVQGGQAQCSLGSLGTGSHGIMAVYSGDNTNYASTSSVLQQLVTAASADVVLAPSGVETTLTTTTAVIAAPGSTLLIPVEMGVVGVRVTLEASPLAAQGLPVTLVFGTRTLSLTPQNGEVAIVVLDPTSSGATVALVPRIESGTVSVTAAAHEPLLALRSRQGVVVAGSQGATATESANGAAGTPLWTGLTCSPAFQT